MIEIIGIDHGFKNMKTAHKVFPTALTKLTAKPDDLNGVIEYNNQYYSLHGTPLISENNYDKVQNMDFYILTLAAIAKELKNRNGKQSQAIRIAAGLPQKWYLQQKQEFKKYLSRESIVRFEFEGEKYKVDITNVNIYAQGHAALVSKISEYKDKYFVGVDIGGGTVDIIPIINGKPIESDCKIDLHGCNWLLNEIKEAVESRLMTTVPESVIQDYILTHNKKSTSEQLYDKILQEELKKYCELIFTILKKFKIDPSLIPIVFLGGGAGIIHDYGTYGKNVDFILDVSANAKGFELIDKALAKKAEKGKK